MKWIGVDERLPEESRQVLTTWLIHSTHREYRVDYLINLQGLSEPYIWARRLHDEMHQVTHWAEIEPPMSKEEKEICNIAEGLNKQMYQSMYNSILKTIKVEYLNESDKEKQ